MGILDRLFRKKLPQRLTPLTDLAIERIDYLLKVIPLRQHMSTQGLEALILQILDDVQHIETSADPIRTSRLALVDRTLLLANYQVIVMEPEPSPDPTGLRALGGVTGHIKAHVFDLFKADPDFEQDTMRGHAENYEQAWNIALFKYWQAKLIEETLSTVRKYLIGEAAAESPTDWHKPFLHSACIVAEQRYRNALGLPSALPVKDPEDETCRHQTLLEFVLSQEESPYLAWTQHYQNHPPGMEAHLAVYERFGRMSPRVYDALFSSRSTLGSPMD